MQSKSTSDSNNPNPRPHDSGLLSFTLGYVSRDASDRPITKCDPLCQLGQRAVSGRCLPDFIIDMAEQTPKFFFRYFSKKTGIKLDFFGKRIIGEVRYFFRKILDFIKSALPKEYSIFLRIKTGLLFYSCSGILRIQLDIPNRPHSEHGIKVE